MMATATHIRHHRTVAAEAFAIVTRAARKCRLVPHVAGSFLRCREHVKDLDVVITVPDGQELADAAEALSEVLFGEPRGGIRIIRGEVAGVPCDLYLCTPAEAGAMRMFLTGPAGFNIHCRQLAQRRGWKLSQYGLFDAHSMPIVTEPDESALFAALGLEYFTPQQREAFA